MSYINNLGDYVELLHTLLTRAVADKATVQYDHEPDRQDKPKPFIKLPLPEIIGTSYANDGRQQDTLAVTVLIKAPKNLNNPSVEAANIGGFVRAKMTEQYFDDATQMGTDKVLLDDFDCVDAPEDIQGYPLKWHSNEQGYAITFEQTIRYGNLEAETFLLKSISVLEAHLGEKIIYESEQVAS